MINQFLKRFTIYSLIGVSLTSPIQVNAQDLPSVTSTSSDSQARLWNLKEVDIHQVIDEVAEETGKNFLVDPRVTGRVSIITTHAIDKRALYQVFLSILAVHGYTAIEDGKVIKIIPRGDAKHQGGVSIGDKATLAVTVKVIQLNNLSAPQLISVLRPLLPPEDHLAAYAPSNTLIIASTTDNIERISQIVAAMDSKDKQDIDMVPLHYASANNVANSLNRLQINHQNQKVTVVADERTNSIMLSGPQSARLRLRTMISQLDNPHPNPGIQNTDVVYLQYQKAKDLAPILNKILQKTTLSNPETTGDNHSYVEAETTANALIIHASATEISTLNTIIQRLDVRPAQVLVEAAIVELDDKTAEQLGIQWGTISQTGAALADSFAAGMISGLPIGFNQGVGVIKNGSLREIVTLLSSSNAANILSTPTVVVVDNQQAKIEVGKTVSIETGSYSNTAATQTVNPFTTFQRDNIGLHLYVTPQITQGNTVKLNIDQGNETLENPTDPGTTPITNTSSLKTTVLVNTGDILVLGGIISHAMTESNTKIPLVGDLPVVGKAFQFKHHQVEKKNLMIFLKPLILRNASMGDHFTEKKYSEIRNQEIKHSLKDGTIVAEPNDNILPHWHKDATLPVPFVDNSSVNPA